MSETVISVENLSKRYLIGDRSVGDDQDAFREKVGRNARSLLQNVHGLFSGRETTEREKASEFWALRNVSFEVKRGEILGIIGHNGAGKSTLLKILSRITEPTSGRISMRGRVASLLEVGTGFHPDLTGRENVFLNGAILGMSRREVKSKFDEIVGFAEVEKFVDTPVKRYSSGMYVRLAFAVAAHLDPEILILDEVLAVGDAAFQKKCIGKMSDVAQTGRTVLFVSHNINAMKSLCTRGIILANGEAEADLPIERATSFYLRKLLPPDEEIDHWNVQDSNSDDIELTNVQLRGDNSGVGRQITPQEAVQIEVSYRQFHEQAGERFVFQFLTESGDVAFTGTDQSVRVRPTSAGNYTTTCHVPGGFLNTGLYRLRLWAGIPGQRALLPQAVLGSFRVSGDGNQGSTYEVDKWPGAVCPKLEWEVVQVTKTVLRSELA